MRFSIRNLIDAILLPFCKLERINFEAPWRSRPPTAC